MHDIIVCTDEGYDETRFNLIASMPHSTENSLSFNDYISRIVKDLLIESKNLKLQTNGYSLDNPSGAIIDDKSSLPVKCNFININKQMIITSNWEKVYMILGESIFTHMYKEYMIFMKTRDESLVQISGQNIFSFLYDKVQK